MAHTVSRILLGLLALLALLALLLAGSILVDAALGQGRVRAVANTQIPGNGGPDVQAYVAIPEGGGPFPEVIMIHEFYGVNESITGNAQALAEQGYVVVAPDTFRGSSTAWVPRAILQVITTPSDRVNQDLDAVFAHLQTLPQVNPERIAVQGFCYGGRAALTYSLHNPRLAATVIFYGSPETDPQVLQTLPGPVLGIFGGADTSIPVSEVRQFEAALEEAGIPHEISIYEDQPHAFVGDIASIRAGGPEAEAWQQMLTFLEQTLQSQTGVSGSFGALDYHQPFAWRYYLMLAYEHAFGSASHDH